MAEQTPESLALGIKISRELADEDAVKRYGITLIAKYPSIRTSERIQGYFALMTNNNNQTSQKNGSDAEQAEYT